MEYDTDQVQVVLSADSSDPTEVVFVADGKATGDSYIGLSFGDFA